jgi:hypothetical protein
LSQPYFERVWRWDSHSQNGNFKVFRDSRNFSLGVATPLWGKCEVVTHTPENGTWKSSEIPKNLALDFKGQNTLHWSVFYTVGKVLKSRCPKWPCMSHLDIFYHKLWSNEGPGIKLAIWLPTTKSRESTRPWCVQVECDTPWKALKERYEFASDLIPIRGLNKKLWTPKVPGVQIETILGLHFGNPGKKCHSDASTVE